MWSFNLSGTEDRDPRHKSFFATFVASRIMARNERYSHESPHGRTDAPLPPLPPSEFDRPTEYQSSISPITSPIDEPSYRTYGRRSQQSIASNHEYYGDRDHEPNPFSDDIPLRNHSQMEYDGAYGQEQPRYEPRGFSNSLPPRTQSTRSRGKKGLFSSRVPWVTYAFTLIQSIVFLVELIKNGKSTFLRWNVY